MLSPDGRLVPKISEAQMSAEIIQFVPRSSPVRPGTELIMPNQLFWIGPDSVLVDIDVLQAAKTFPDTAPSEYLASETDPA